MREVPIRSDTRFVLTRPGVVRFERDGVNHIIAQTPWTIVRPRDASTEFLPLTFIDDSPFQTPLPIEDNVVIGAYVPFEP